MSDRLVRAGNPLGLDVAAILGAKALLGALGALLGLLYLIGSPSLLAVAIAVVATFIGFNVPDLLLVAARDRRNDDVRRQAADVVDQLTVIVEAGLGLEAAMNRVADSTGGPLADEFRRTLQDIRAGVPRARAMKSMGERVEIPEIRQLTTSIIQAEIHGVPIARTLRIQAGEIRLRQYQAAEERAMKLPVKIVFPTLVCIMPALFVVILGPAVVRILNGFT